MIEIESYTDEYNMKTILMQYDDRKYGIKVVDLDSWEALPTVCKFEDEGKAYAKYNRLKVL
jgi:hypothetical protein